MCGLYLLLHMGLGAEAVRQELGQGPLHIGTVLPHKIDFEIVLTEFPHDLAADAAGWEHIGNDPILSAADRNGRKNPVAIVDRLEKGRALGAVRCPLGAVFNIAAAIDRAVGAQQSLLLLVLL